MDAVEAKALTVAQDAAGGFLAPETSASELIKLTTEFSPIRSYANVQTISGDSIVYPRRTGTTAAVWVGETEDRTASQPSYEQITLANHELATYTDVSMKLLEDNVFNLEGELMPDFAENFGKTEGGAFVKGTGVGQPKGLMTATGIAEVKTGVAASFPASDPADVLIGMYHKLPTSIAQRGAWALNRNTLAVIRTWRDGDGRLLLNDARAGGFAELLGRPVIEMVDMDDIGAGKFPIVFGDFSGFRIVDRIGLSLLRDPYTLATKGQVRFHARKRTGSDVTHSRPLREAEGFGLIMLPARDITVEIGGEVIRLRPTLRAATRLNREYGFDELFRLLSQGSVAATTAILAEHVDTLPNITCRTPSVSRPTFFCT